MRHDRRVKTLSTPLRGRALLADPGLNKGSAFTVDERQALGLTGLLPAAVESIDQQLARTRLEFDRMHDDLERHVYLRALQDHNETLFYAFLRANLTETMPIVYTPTVGLASLQFSRIYRRSQGMFLAWPDRATLVDQLAAVEGDIDVIVVTDGERILGLGDQGAGGFTIPNGKLALYSAFGGIDPMRTLPIVLDVGTNNEERLADPGYLGWRHERITGVDYDDFVASFIDAVAHRFPGVLLQWEDFASHNATRLMNRHRTDVLSFNDDIEGTAAVALSAMWSAIKGVDRSLADQQFCIVGAGSAGTGIARMLISALHAEGVEQPLEQIWMLDRHGLVHDQRDDLDSYQLDLAHSHAHLAELPATLELATGGQSLDQVVQATKATVLVGVSGQPDLFTEPAVRSMLANTDAPVIMPLSNPTSRAEATPADLIAWTDGAAIIATGSPFDPVEHRGETHHISQANNVYVFPGLGLGALVAGATQITPEMLMSAAIAVFGAESGGVRDGVLPPLDAVPEVSRRIAAAVVRCAQDQGLATNAIGDDAIDEAVTAYAWEPEYPTVVAT